MPSLRYSLLLIPLLTGGIAQATTTALYLQRQGGDFISQGDKYAYVDIATPHEKFSADFERNCDGDSSGYLFGSIRINEVLQQISITNAVITNRPSLIMPS